MEQVLIDRYRCPESFVKFDLIGLAHLDPQRGGCCTVMPYFVGDILEIPVTTTQDYALFHVLNEYSLDLCGRLRQS